MTYCVWSTLWLSSTWIFAVCVTWSAVAADEVVPIIIGLADESPSDIPPPGDIPAPSDIPPPGDIPAPSDIPPPGDIPAPSDIPPPGDIPAPSDMPPGDMPDSGHNTDSDPTLPSTLDSSVGPVAGINKVEETGSMPAAETATAPAPAVADALPTVAVPVVGVTSSVPVSEAVPETGGQAANDPGPAASSPPATLPVETTLPPPTLPPPPPPPTPAPTHSADPGEGSTQPPYLPPASPPGRPTPSPGDPSPTPAVDAEDTEDEADEEAAKTETGNGTAGGGGEEPPCDFDPCEHLQRPCPEVREVAGRRCRCSGLDLGPAVSPDPVVALNVMWAGPRVARVWWCAPYSALSGFQVWALRHDGSAFSNGSVSSRARQADVFGLEPRRAYGVCVRARNGAGVSRERCVPVSTPADGEAIALYVLAGACSALLLTAAVLSACLHRQCKRGQVPPPSTPEAPAAAAPLSPSTVPALHDPRLSSLVSIPNPAYTHADEQAVPPPVNTHYAHGPPKKSTVRKK